jgi:outer membrane protein TolC
MKCPVELFSLAAAFCLLAGCQTFHSQPISSSKTAENFDSRTLNNPELREFLERNLRTNFSTWPPRSWDFSKLILAAFYYHPSLDVARAQWMSSDASVISAKTRPNPTISISPEYDFSATKNVSPWIAGFNFDLPIETAGKRGYRSARAQYLSEAARLNIGSVAWEVRKNLRDSLIDFNTAKKEKALLEKQKEIQTKIAAILKKQLQAGAITPFENSTAQLVLSKTELDLGAAKLQLAEARSRVAEALGVPRAALDGIEFLSAFSTAFDGSDLTVPEVRRQALQNRSDILSSLGEYAASQSALQLEIAKQYPDLHLGTGYQYDQGDNKWSLIGISLELPLLNQNQGGIADAKAHRNEIAAKFVAMQAKVISEIDRAIAVYQIARAQLKTSATLWQTQQQRERSVAAQFKAGALDRSEWLTAQIELGAAELAQADLRTKAEHALSDLEFAVQRPLDSAETLLSEFEKNTREKKENQP